jgi:hypothetical protein
MGYASCLEDNIERFNNALQVQLCKPERSGGYNLSAVAETIGTTPARVMALRAWVERVTKECAERLACEMIVVCKREAQRTVVQVKYMSKGEAAEIVPDFCGGDLLDLDDLYGGTLWCDGYMLLSERKFAEILRKQAPALHDEFNELRTGKVRSSDRAGISPSFFCWTISPMMEGACNARRARRRAHSRPTPHPCELRSRSWSWPSNHRQAPRTH